MWWWVDSYVTHAQQRHVSLMHKERLGNRVDVKLGMSNLLCYLTSICTSSTLINDIPNKAGCLFITMNLKSLLLNYFMLLLLLLLSSIYYYPMMISRLLPSLRLLLVVPRSAFEIAITLRLARWRCFSLFIACCTGSFSSSIQRL